MLDEPTAALGVAQTARGAQPRRAAARARAWRHPDQPQHGRRLAVADRVVVLRLGRNNGDVPRQRRHQRGDHRRHHRRHRQRRSRARAARTAGQRTHDRHGRTADPGGRRHRPSTRAAGCRADLLDQRLIPAEGLARLRRSAVGAAPQRRPRRRCRSSSAWSSSGPSSRSLNPTFLSSAQPRQPHACRCAAVGTIAIGVVLVLLLGEIDLSVGSVSGLAAAVLAVLVRQPAGYGSPWHPGRRSRPGALDRARSTGCCSPSSGCRRS